MSGQLIFPFGLALILTHEMDAVRLHEWRMFRFLSALPEERAYAAFTMLHIPLYALMFWGLYGTGNPAVGAGVAAGLDVFFIIHVLLHVLFIRHPQNRFRSTQSWGIIVGASLCGLLDLLL
jgi:hypothetical protein